MATWELDSKTGKKFNNKTVKEVAYSNKGREYLRHIHKSNKYNVSLSGEVLDLMDVLNINVREALPLTNETVIDAKERVINHFGYYPFNVDGIVKMIDHYSGVAINCIDNELYLKHYHKKPFPK